MVDKLKEGVTNSKVDLELATDKINLDYTVHVDNTETVPDNGNTGTTSSGTVI